MHVLNNIFFSLYFTPNSIPNPYYIFIMANVLNGQPVLSYTFERLKPPGTTLVDQLAHFFVGDVKPLVNQALCVKRSISLTEFFLC